MFLRSRQFVAWHSIEGTAAPTHTGILITTLDADLVGPKVADAFRLMVILDWVSSWMAGMSRKGRLMLSVTRYLSAGGRH